MLIERDSSPSLIFVTLIGAFVAFAPSATAKSSGTPGNKPTGTTTTTTTTTKPVENRPNSITRKSDKSSSTFFQNAVSGKSYKTGF
jgi:hypothetical protein